TQGQGLHLRSCILGTKPGKNYRLSAYMKSLSPGMKISFAGEKISLGSTWQRYVVPFVNSGRESYYGDMINIIPLSKGTFWVDAVQLEKGKAASPYNISVRDVVLNVHFNKTAKGNKSGPQVPVLKASRLSAGSPFQLDGKLDENCWRNLQTMNLVLTNGQTPTVPTQAKIFYTEKGICIGIRCSERNHVGNCKVNERDGAVWNDPCVEIFLDPRASLGTDYYHLAVNSKGVQYDAYAGDKNWNGNWRAETAQGENFWSAEIFIPFTDLGIDRSIDDFWRMNICRENHREMEYSCWSPTFGEFHRPEYFGRLEIDRKNLEQYCFYCEKAWPDNVDGQTGMNFTLKNDTAEDRDVLMEVEITNAKGEPQNQSRKVFLEKEKRKTVFCKSQGEVKKGSKIQLRLFSKDKRFCFLNKELALDNCLPFFKIISRYGLYTKEKEIEFYLKTNYARHILEQSAAMLELVDETGKNVKKQLLKNLFINKKIAFSSAPLANGKYKIKCTVKNSEGGILYSGSDDFVKLPAKPCEVKTDRWNQVVCVAGSPFVPVAYVAESNPGKILKYLSQQEFNSLVVYQRHVDSGLLDRAAENNLKVIIWTQTDRDEKKDQEKTAFISKYKEHPAILAWCIFDEKFTALADKVDKTDAKELHRIITNGYQRRKKLDPYHLTIVNEAFGGISLLNKRKLSFPGDVVSMDYYSFTDPTSLGIPQSANYTRILYSMAEAENKPCWYYLSGGLGYAFMVGREYTAAEQTFSTYTALINGITGILYFSDHPRSRANWEAIKNLIREIKELTPVIASSDELKSVITCSSSRIQWLAKRLNNQIYVIALNKTIEPVSAKFFVSNQSSSQADVDVLFENRKIQQKHGAFKDFFPGYARRVYKITVN
ncbi:MAG: carbohydrate-binding family 9-like protein, partial [Victivallaceae bacterium]|nr:carbohydrate-binding family 9-like protein [Victivallaceae bacterium]